MTSQLLHPTPDELRALVLDYLYYSSFTKTARAFVGDTTVRHLDADGDEVMSDTQQEDDSLDERLTLCQLRQNVRMQILSGRIDDATALLDEHFPAVLAESSEDSLENGYLAVNTSHYLPPTSIDPLHLALNLHIHAFIEATRTIPLPYHPPDATSSPPPTLPLRAAGDGQTEELLHRAQNLYSEAHRLPRETDRTVYLDELQPVAGLLAYKQPEDSPMSVYLTQERRAALADQIDIAIMCRAGLSPVSRMELCARHTSALWSTMQELLVKIPPRSAWPAGVFLPSHSTDEKQRLSPFIPKKSSTGRESAEVVPPFDLGEFLDRRP